MTERRTAGEIRTDRPGVDITPDPLAVADVLALEPVRAGFPQVVAGHAALDRTVRWVHIVDTPEVAGFLQGGELVLTTGAAWPDDGELSALTEELLDAGAAGIVLELGARFARVPEAVRDVCDRRGVPLIALHEVVRFVAITEAAHRLLVSSQVAALQARDEVQALFSELNRAGAPAEVIVSEVARLVGLPVVLEDLAHRVVCCATHGRSETDVLQDWARRSRVGVAGSGRHRIVEVAARGRRWGRLVAVGDPAHLASSADAVLAQGALALSLDAMAATTERGSSWESLRHRRALETVLQRHYTSPAHLRRVLESAGLHLSAGQVAALAWRLSREATDRPGWVERSRQAFERAAGALRVQCVCGPVTSVPGGMLALLVLPPGTESAAADEAIDQLAERLRSGPETVDVVTAGRPVAATGPHTEQLLTSVGQARDLLETAGPATPGVLRVRGTELVQLTSAVPPPRMQAFVEEMLGPILTYDARHGTDLVAVLEVYLRYPGNRTLAAQKSHLSRSVFYQRLELIESQLDRDLHDGTTLAALHVAVVAHGLGVQHLPG